MVSLEQTDENLHLADRRLGARLQAPQNDRATKGRHNEL